MIQHHPAACALALFLCSAVSAREWDTAAEVNAQHDSNLNNSPFASDVLRDRSISAMASTSTTIPLRAGEQVTVGGHVQSEVFNRYSGLNNRALGATIAWRKKWGLGAFAPWTGLELTSTRLNFNNSIRDGWRHQLAPSIGQRLTERWNVRTEYLLEWRTAKSLEGDSPGISGDVFTQASQSAILNAEYAASDKLLLGFGYLIRHGDVVATVREHPGTNIVESATAIAADTLFGDEFYTYRLTGTTQGPSLDAAIELSRDWQMRASMQHLATRGAGGNNYSKNVATVSWRHDF